MTGIDSESKAHGERSLLVWDAEGSPPSGNWTIILWNSVSNTADPDLISIPVLVEEEADALRARYLAWIYELGEMTVKGKRLVDHLELRPGFSYWWMTSLAQKFNVSGTSQIEHAIKAIVLDKLVSKLKPQSILLTSCNANLASVLKFYCQSKKMQFTWSHTKTNIVSDPVAKRIYSSLPYSVRACIYLLWYLLRSLPSLCARQTGTPLLKSDIAFIDVLVHLDTKAFTLGRFFSNYWTALVDKLNRSNVKVNWIHNYFRQELLPTLVQAKDLIDRFNKDQNEKQTHMLIERNLSLAVMIKALKDYFRIYRSYYRMREISPIFEPTGSAINLWPLYEQEWIDSLKGQNAILNCLRISLYEKTFNEIPYQKMGVFIQENQPWEMALIYIWKSAGHGKLIGVPHSTVRFWDLRYFYDSRSYERIGNNILPIPEQVAVNGPVAKNTYLAGGYPETRITEVEALRYLYLHNHTEKNTEGESNNRILKILVCGDFHSDTSRKMLFWLSSAAKLLPLSTKYILKPHPAYPIKLDDFTTLPLEVTTAPLSEILKECNVVFTSNITSAAVDAYFYGVPVVQMWDGATFNISPLRGLNGVKYVTNPVELAEGLRNNTPHERVLPESYFYLNENIPRWLKLLGINPKNTERTAIS